MKYEGGSEKTQKKIYPKIQTILSLMIPNEKGWHYLAVESLPELLTGTTSKHNADFYC